MSPAVSTPLHSTRTRRVHLHRTSRSKDGDADGLLPPHAQLKHSKHKVSSFALALARSSECTVAYSRFRQLEKSMQPIHANGASSLVMNEERSKATDSKPQREQIMDMEVAWEMVGMNMPQSLHEIRCTVRHEELAKE